MADDENDDILEIHAGGAPRRAKRRLPVFEDEIAGQPLTGEPGASEREAPSVEIQQPAPPPINAPIMASEPSGLSPPPQVATTQWVESSRVYGPGDAWLGRVLGADAELGASQSITVERSIVGYTTNNEPTLGVAPAASSQPTIGVVSALPFPPRHDQAGYLVEAGDAVMVGTGRDGRRYFLNDELPFIGVVKSIDFENDTLEVTRQALSGDPDDEDFHGATLANLEDAASDDVDVPEVLLVGGVLPGVDEEVCVHRRGRYHFIEGREGILVRNDTESDQLHFAVLKIGAPLILPSVDLQGFLKCIAFSGLTPDDSTPTGYFVITAVALAVGEIGPATVSGPCIVKIDVPQGKTAYEFAESKTGETGFLEPIEFNTSGTMILWKEAGIGEKWAIVRMSNPAFMELA